MFDNKIIVEDSLAAEQLADGRTGVSVLARLPYYRGLGLSMVENIQVVIDGKDIDRENVRFAVRGNMWTLDEMETEYGDRWNFGEKAKVIALTDSPVTKGEHEVSVAITMRVSYLPFVPTSGDVKTLVL
ncbi:MAG: hypothetical protein GYB58_06905 [Gammaproteobacteria bacterium]|nr:hypothetical protein [Gammaproteobacteria bacterium]